ncbi:MAG: iron ABC transporter substrate-binding protein [Actinomyces succiniciruminis]|uniref:Periplasmic binding protein n=1 Tax=Actinomyces succiniciruminis TaxID=1522002 RepID=A0A1L7RGS5_9ACTO|nr:ABC transporter substrate-binding protein [Actinomyces succiniciruminis]MBE6474964.1 iron ABC transporter substrate-binding protein [Actinomyces succiniciruminis]CED90706.1 Periplasmic binding protein [Actinomyces succiniciruminis]
MSRKLPALLALSATVSLALAGCSGSTDSASTSAASDTASASVSQASSVTIEDNHGSVEVSLPVQRAASTDNRTFEVLADWGVPLVAAPKQLVPSSITAYDGDDVADIGNHREPDLEALAAAEPDLVIVGQRFSDQYDSIAELTPDAALLDLEPRDGESFDAELERQVTALGQVFGKEAEADQLIADFEDALERAKNAYDGSSTVMAVIVSGGEIGYSGPTTGRTWGPLFDLLGLEPALEVEGSTDDHQGDDVSVEQIAESNPDWILVMDRDAAITADEPDYTPAADVIAGNAALQNVTAVTSEQIVYAPDDTYTNESIITYTEILNSIADAFEGAQN